MSIRLRYTPPPLLVHNSQYMPFNGRFWSVSAGFVKKMYRHNIDTYIYYNSTVGIVGPTLDLSVGL